jgi:hypothetical protein
MGKFERRTYYTRIVCDVFAQLLFPGEGFLIWYDIPDDDAAAAAQTICGLRIYCCSSECGTVETLTRTGRHDGFLRLLRRVAQNLSWGSRGKVNIPSVSS